MNTLLKCGNLEDSIVYGNKVQNRPKIQRATKIVCKFVFDDRYAPTMIPLRSKEPHPCPVHTCTVHTRWKSAADTRDYVYAASRVVPIVSRRRDAARSTLEKGRDWMEFEAKPPIPASIFKFSVLHSPFVRYTNSTTIPFSPLTFLQRNSLNRGSKENRTMEEPGLYEREFDARSLLSELVISIIRYNYTTRTRALIIRARIFTHL